MQPHFEQPVCLTISHIWGIHKPRREEGFKQLSSPLSISGFWGGDAKLHTGSPVRQATPDLHRGPVARCPASGQPHTTPHFLGSPLARAGVTVDARDNAPLLTTSFFQRFPSLSVNHTANSVLLSYSLCSFPPLRYRHLFSLSQRIVNTNNASADMMRKKHGVCRKEENRPTLHG